MKKQTKLEELEKRIKVLEDRPIFLTHPIFDPKHFTTYTPYHYHGLMPCYQNPCNF